MSQTKQSSAQVLTASLLEAAQEHPVLTRLEEDEVEALLNILFEQQFADSRRRAQEQLEEILTGVVERLMEEDADED